MPRPRHIGKDYWVPRCFRFNLESRQGLPVGRRAAFILYFLFFGDAVDGCWIDCCLGGHILPAPVDVGPRRARDGVVITRQLGSIPQFTSEFCCGKILAARQGALRVVVGTERRDLSDGKGNHRGQWVPWLGRLGVHEGQGAARGVHISLLVMRCATFSLLQETPPEVTSFIFRPCQ